MDFPLTHKFDRYSSIVISFGGFAVSTNDWLVYLFFRCLCIISYGHFNIDILSMSFFNVRASYTLSNYRHFLLVSCYALSFPVFTVILLSFLLNFLICSFFCPSICYLLTYPHIFLPSFFILVFS